MIHLDTWRNLKEQLVDICKRPVCFKNARGMR